MTTAPNICARNVPKEMWIKGILSAKGRDTVICTLVSTHHAELLRMPMLISAQITYAWLAFMIILRSILYICDKYCDDHRCSTDGCRNLRQSPLLVCATHYPDEKKQCMGTKSNKTRCKAVTQIGGINDWYCQAHIHQAPPNLKLDIDFNFVDICYPIKSAQCNQKVGIEKCQEVGYISKESSRWKCFFHSLSPPSNEPVRPAIKKKFERKEKNTAPEKVSSYATTLHDSGLSQDDLEDNLGISEEFDEAEVENDALGRLREIGDGVEDRDDYSEADIDDDRFQYLQSTDVDNVVVNSMQRELHDLTARFSWDLSGKLLHLLCRLLNRLIMLSNEYISEGRREVSFAQSETLRLASIVGATVVGASTRLQAIRNARPSVVIVEEACEVLEPTLISVLAVDSIKKLQLIGDHFQLPASIQNDWFNISMDKNFRSLKKSLFERLIDSGMVPVTVLDIQRRMRWDISDTIRPFYRDLVEINDHQNTFSRSITMDNDIRNKLKGMGMTVPGIASTIFFWDLIDSQESPAEVGLSTINKGEAESVVGLTKWLLDCHVPASSITIITPYKGQSTDIYKRLRNLNLVGISQHGEHQGVNVSTVDRFQGDEADIVILSIVKSSKSAFVGLRNRFIVAASRARIGFFIVGCKNALTGADHWQRYLEILKFSTSNSPTGASRVARRLPLCCPYHDSVKATRYASSSREFPIKERWGEFCKEPCQDILPWCSHACNLPCHVVPSAHNSNCREKVPSTCRDHPDAVVICQNVFEQTERVLKQSCLSLQEARNHYLCEEIVEDFLKSCQEHWIRSPKCHEYKSYIHTPPVCVEKVLFTRPTCGCVVKMTCVERAKEQLNPVRCEIRKTLKRPRCYHDMQLPCYCESELLRMWASNGCLSISGSTVKHGEKYGPSEIMVTTECRRKDSSKSKLVAAKSFIGNQVCVRTLRATDIGSVVNEDTEHYNIAFGQFVRLLGPNVTTNTISSIDVIEYPPTNPVRVAFEKKRVEFSSERPAEELWVFHGTQSDSVTKIVQIGFKVGGQAGVPIVHGAALGSGVYTAKGPSTPLNYGGLKSVILARGLVGSRQRDSKFCNGDWVIFTSGSQLLPCYVVYFNEQQSTMSTPSPPIRGRTLRSSSPAGLVSSSAHHHDQSIQSIVDCHDAISKILPCNSKVQYQRVCGHTVKGVACWAAFEYASGNLPYPDNCTVPIGRPCLFCKSSLDIPCWANNAYDQLQSLVPSDFCVNLSEHEFPDYQQQWSEVLTQHGELEILLHSLCAHGSLKFKRKCCGTSMTRTCKEVFAFITAKSVLPKCTIMFSRSLPCGHEDRVPCWMFNSLAVCREWVQRKSPICGHQVNVRCNLSEKSWQPWGGGNMPIPTTQVGGDIHLYLEEHITKKRVQFNNGVRPGDWRCDKPCIIQRRCGHRKELLCCEALSDMPIPICTDLSSIKCNKCTSLRHVPCNELDVEKLKPCKEEVTKKCTLCLVNDIRVPCDAMVAVCNKESSRMLPCKHSVTWLCGYHPVPSDRDCPTCLLQTWANANDREQRTQFDNPSIMRSFQAVVNDTMTVRWLDQVEVIADESIVGFRLDQHCIRRAQLMDASMKLVSNSQKLFSVDDSVLLFPLPPCPIDDDRAMMNYELVFIESKELARTKYVGNPFDVLRNTEFGRGITCTKLDMNSLSKCIPSDDNGDGSIEIIVGFAFSVRPFKGLRASLPKSTRQLRACYDCIALSDEPQRITYLHDCSIVPVKMIRLRVRLRCDYACLDFHDRKNCYICPSCEPKHAICWECLIHYLESSTGVDSGNAFNKDGTTLVCCFCHNAIDITTLGSSEQAKACLIKIVDINKKQFAERAAIQASNAATRVTEAMYERRLEELRTTQRNVMIEDIRRDIIENVLTIKCPRCKCAFIDYDGCNALTCSNTQCRAGFCALCYIDCGHDAHDHIRNAHPGQMHTRQEEWIEFNKIRQRAEVKLRTKNLTPEEVKKALQGLDI